MFSLTHILWLVITTILVIVMLFIVEHKKISYEKVITIMFIVSCVIELIKIFNNMTDTTTQGKFLDPESLPFHLCSIQILFITALKFLKLNDKSRTDLLSFMFPTMLLGGVLACLIPTCGTSFTKIQVYQFFGFHGFIIFFAIYICKNKMIDMGFKGFKRNIFIIFILTIITIWINSILSSYNTNFMYLTRPPMENLPILNLNHGWYVYFMHLVAITIIMMVIIHLPFIIKEKKLKSK